MCAKRPKKNDFSLKDRFPVFINSVFPILVVFLFFLNVILVWRVFDSTKPKLLIQYHETTNTVYRVLSVTQWFPIASSDYDPSHDVSAADSSSYDVQTVSFDYFEVNGCPGFRYLDRIYYVGYNTSLGVVLSIFPDRVNCSNGAFVLGRSGISSDRGRSDPLPALKSIRSPLK